MRIESTMPYSVKNPPKALVKRIKKRHPKAGKKEVKQFIHVFNGAIADGDGESTAYAKAWGVLNNNKKLKSSHHKTDPTKTKKETKKQDKKTKKKSSYDKLIDLSNTLISLGQKDAGQIVRKIAYQAFLPGGQGAALSTID